MASNRKPGKKRDPNRIAAAGQPDEVKAVAIARTGLRPTMQAAGENPNLQSKLLEENDGERLDPGTTSTPGRTDPAMATVGEVDRAEDRGR